MTREEALKLLIGAWEHCGRPGCETCQRRQDAIAALSSPCACGGGKILTAGWYHEIDRRKGEWEASPYKPLGSSRHVIILEASE